MSNLNLTQLPDLSDFHALKGLWLNDNPIGNISSLAGDERIEILCLANTNVHVLPDLPELKELLATDSALTDVSALARHADKLVKIQLPLRATGKQALRGSPAAKGAARAAGG